MFSSILLVSYFLIASSAAQDDGVHPAKLRACLEATNIAEAVSVDLRMNPYYLRGDFDHDGRPDFAVAVTAKKTKKNEVLFCLANGKNTIVGADQVATSDRPLVAPNWEVATVEDVLEFRKTNKQVPIPKGESVLMFWEDGMHYIFWDGARFRVSPMMQ